MQITTPNKGVIMSEKLMKYEAKDGQLIELNFDLVRKYLVRGKTDLVSNKEIMYFSQICKSKGLNPLKNDCYLIKFSDDPAAIIVSIDFLRSRAKACKDCNGWEAGVIVQTKKGDLRYSNGLVLDNETLIGGWARAKPEGWDQEMIVEVNLKSFKKNNQFWAAEKQAVMIQKVAESQLLRKCWPDEFQGLYVDGEIGESKQDKAEELNKKLGLVPGEQVVDVESEEVIEGDEEDPLDPKNWKFLRADGFKEWVSKNLTVILKEHPDNRITMQIIQKWNKFFSDVPFPTQRPETSEEAPESPTVDENDSSVSYLKSIPEISNMIEWEAVKTEIEDGAKGGTISQRDYNVFQELLSEKLDKLS